MLTVIFPLAGCAVVLGHWLSDVALPYIINLYKNDYTPVSGSVEADFTIADFSGYVADQTLSGWTGPVPDGAGRMISNSDPATWTHDAGAGGNAIYGWYMLDGATGIIVCAERFTTAPIGMNVNGDTLSVTPHLTERSEF